MPRATSGVASHRRHKKVLKFTKGQYGTRSKLFRRANEAMLKSLFYAYRDRRNRKRDFRRLWITRINAASRIEGLSVQPLRPRTEEGERAGGPQSACRHRSA